MKYPNSLVELEKDFDRATSSPITDLARSLVEHAKKFDLMKAHDLGVNFRYVNADGKIRRDQNNPVFFVTQEARSASWTEPLDNPLQKGEVWNEGRRKTASGERYDVCEDSPINPYMNTGMTGRGCLGLAGPNHAVDNGILLQKPDETGVEQLYALGVLRKYDNNTPAFAGGFAKFDQDENGFFVFNEHSVIQTMLEEFFEEMISGSVDLLPEYFAKLPDDKIHDEDEIAHLKFEQVSDLDPGFVERLRARIAGGKECFAGPVLNDDRNTNNSWLETRLSWSLMDKNSWLEIRGESPVFDYQLSAGDDASDVVWHKIDPALIDTAFASHGAMFTFMTASYLLHMQENGVEVAPSIIQQLKNLNFHLLEISQNMPDALSCHIV